MKCSGIRIRRAANPKGGGHFERLVGKAGVLESLDARPVDLCERVQEWTRAQGWEERVGPWLLY